jgi:hypothetical protein
MKITPLKLNGKPFDPHPPRPAFVKIAAWLDARPGEVFTRDVVTEQMKLGICTVTAFYHHSAYATYAARTSKLTVLGTPSAIQQYRKITESAGNRES